MIQNTKGILDSEAEKKVFSCLEQLINTDSYRIAPHVSILDAFEKIRRSSDIHELYNKYCNITNQKSEKEKQIELCHFDFVICDKKSFIPYVIIEVNGKDHYTKPDKVHFDLFKRFIVTNMFERPFITLDFSSSIPDEKIPDLIKKSLISNGLNKPYSRPVFCPECNRKMFYKNGKNGIYYSCQSCKKKNGSSLTVENDDIPQIINETS